MSFKPAERVGAISQEDEPHVQAVWLAQFPSGADTKQRRTMKRCVSVVKESSGGSEGEDDPQRREGPMQIKDRMTAGTSR